MSGPLRGRVLVTGMVVAAVLGVSGQTVVHVGHARVTQSSTVSDNRLEASRHTPVGSHRLTVAPESGTSLRPEGKGAVRLATLPAGAEPEVVRFNAGDEFSQSMTMPASLTPIEPDDPGWVIAQASDGGWTATHSVRFETETEYTFTSDDELVLPVDVGWSEGVETVTATTLLPDHVTSKRPEDRVQIAIGSTIVDLGVYNTRFDRELLLPGETANLSFDTHPIGAADTLDLRAGDVVTHTLSYPAGLTHREVPARQVRPGMTVEWSSEVPDTLVRTIKVTASTLSLAPETVTVPLQVGLSIEFRSVLGIAVKLPQDLISARGAESLVTQGGGLVLDSIVAGSQHFLALGEDGTAYAWGTNNRGELGLGERLPINKGQPVVAKVETDEKFVALRAAGMASAGLAESGAVYLWGEGSEGNRAFPKKFETDLNFVDFELGEKTYYGLADDGELYAWGANASGQLGVGDREYKSTPTRVETDVRFSSLSTDGSHVVALGEDGAVYTWGWNHKGALGLGLGFDWQDVRTVPTRIDSALRFIQVTATSSGGLALTEDGRLYSWGFNNSGQLGVGDRQDRDTPVLVQTDELFSAIAPAEGALSAIALTPDGRVFSWGSNSYGQLGDPSITTAQGYRTTPAPVIIDGHFARVTLGRSVSALISEDGDAFVAGLNGSLMERGLLGTSDFTSSYVMSFSPLF